MRTELLEQYISEVYGVSRDYIEGTNYLIDGAEVKIYYKSKVSGENEKIVVNVFDILAFVNKKIDSGK